LERRAYGEAGGVNGPPAWGSDKGKMT